MTDPAPTSRDIANARIRQEIADRFQREYDQCLAWAEQVFGQGWEPSHRHFLLDRDEEDRSRRTGERPAAAATVYTVKNPAGERRHFTLVDDKPVVCASVQAGFGSLLQEPHPTRIIEIHGQQVHPHRYSLCWAPIETYQPKSAGELAALRESRERKREERAITKEAEDNPLFADQIRSGEWRPETKKPDRSRG